jgi:hypothetical protein
LRANTVGYFPTCDIWYLQAFNTSVLRDGISYTVYYDADVRETTITLSMRLPVMGGVLGIDVPMEPIQAAADESRITTNGYVFAMKASDGLTVFHPAMNKTEPPRTISHFEPSITWAPILTNPQSSPQLVTKNGNPWYLGCTKVETPDYVLCTLYPSADATADGDHLWSQSTYVTTTGAIVLSILAAAFLIVSMICVRLWSDPVSRSLQRRTAELTNAIEPPQKGTPVISNEFVSISLELQSLMQSVASFGAGMRINQTPVTTATALEAYRVNSEAAAQFRRENQPAALAVALQNCALALHKVRTGDELLPAIADMTEAIQIGVKLAESAENADYQQNQLQLVATRYANLGVIQTDAGRFVDAVRSLTEAIDRHIALRNPRAAGRLGARPCTSLLPRSQTHR